MTIPLPSVKPEYTQEFIESLSPTERFAAAYGVEKKFLRYATPDYTSDPQEQYSIHGYSTISVAGIYNRVTVRHDEQFNNALKLLDSGQLWSNPAGIIIVNSPYHLFGTGIDRDKVDRSPEGFVSHLICSLASRIAKRISPEVYVNFLEVMQLDHSKQYQTKPRHLLVWGPITDHFSSYDYNKTIQFLFAFRNHTRILVTSTQDLGTLLTKLRMDTDAVTYFFNFDVNKEEVAESKVDPTQPKKKAVRKAKAPKEPKSITV